MPRTNASDWNPSDTVTPTRLQDHLEDIDDLYANGDDHGKVVEAAGGGALDVDIGASPARIGETNLTFAGVTDLTLTDDATNYIMLDDTGTVQVSTSSYNAAHARLATAVCASGDIVSITDTRQRIFGGDLGANNPDCNVETLSAGKTLGTSDDRFQNLNCNGDSRIITLETSAMPTGTRFYLKNATSEDDGGALIVKQGSTQLRCISCQNLGIFIFDGTNWKDESPYDSYHKECGDGSDGEYTFGAAQAAVGGVFSKTGTEFKLLKSVQFIDAHVETGYQLNTNGFQLSCIGVLDPQATGEEQIISNGNDGNAGTNASAKTPGVGGTAPDPAHSGGDLPDPATVPDGGDGAAGETGNSIVGTDGESTTGGSVTNSIGSNGIESSDGGDGGSTGASSEDPGTGGTSTGGTATAPTELQRLTNAHVLAIAFYPTREWNGHAGNGSGGGGAEGAGAAQFGNIDTGAGGGGASAGTNGGNMDISCVTLIGAGKIIAKGGDGNDGGNGGAAGNDPGSGIRGAGGGGGGGKSAGGNGGTIWIRYASKANFTGTITAPAGSNGTTEGSGASGVASGNPGSSGSGIGTPLAGIVIEEPIKK